MKYTANILMFVNEKSNSNDSHSKSQTEINPLSGNVETFRFTLA